MANERGGAAETVPATTDSANNCAPTWTRHAAATAIKVAFFTFNPCTGMVHFRTTPLLLLLPRPGDVELLLLPPEFRRAFPRELVPVNRQRVVDGDQVVHELPHDGERQLPILELRRRDLLVL